MISTWLSERRVLLGLSTEALAQYVNVPIGILRSWLDGDDVPPFESLALLTERLADPNHIPGALQTFPLEGSERTGDLVLVEGVGLGHFASRSDGEVLIDLFDGPEGGNRRVGADDENVFAVLLSPQTRVFVHADTGSGWQAGRATSFDPSQGTYLVELPDGKHAHLAARDVFVRAASAPSDPLGSLAEKVHETGYFHAERTALVEALIRHRARTHGLSGLVSSRVELLPHQVGIVRRVCTDPVQRYILADEVGLGKTIEAGAVARQHLLDRPDGRVLVMVPEGLVGQWREEWDHRFALYRHDPRVEIVAYGGPIGDVPTLLIVDEAHHAAGWAWSPSDRAQWDALVEAARAAEAVLLLSATPAATATEAYLAMLHLIDPSAYRLGDRDAFHERVALQETLGRTLLALDPEAPAFLLEQPARDLEALLPADEGVRTRVEDVLSAIARGDARAEVGTLRTWVGETYRLHQRMLRSRRSTASVTPMGRSDDRVREEWGLDGRTGEVLAALDQWRLDALAAPAKSNHSETYRVLLEATGVDLALVSEAARFRLGRGPAPHDLAEPDVRALTAPLYLGEEDNLHAMLLAAQQSLADGDMVRADLLLEALRRPVEDGDGVVVFVTQTGVAEALADRLARGLGSGRIHRRIRGMEPSALDHNVRRFAEAKGAVLVCDRSGEEGVNLQHARHAVLYDLPIDPNRLEQRLGRLDRIGREDDLWITVLMGPEPRDSEVTPWEAWMAVLQEGIGVFRRSAAPLQFLMARIREQALDVLYRGGAEALLKMVPGVVIEVEKEERRSATQDLIDGSDLGREAADVMADLADDDDDTRLFARALGRWLVNVLRFKPEPMGGGHVYRATQTTLVPADVQLHQFLALGVRPTTFDRTEALTRPGVELARVGHPLVDQVAASLTWDDRGQAAAFERSVGDVPGGEQWCGFRFDWTVEADLGPALAVLDAWGMRGPGAASALRRRADALFAPEVVSDVVDTEGRAPSEEIRTTVLLPFETGRDRNLHKNRLERIDGYVPAHAWHLTVKEAGSTSRALVLESSAVARRCVVGASRLERERSQRLPVLRARASHGDAARLPEFEDALLDALAAGIERPTIRLEAAAFVALRPRSDDE